MKYLKKLGEFLCSNEELRYNEKGKAKFKRLGLKAMKELAELLELREYECTFNSGGIAVSGDLRLMGMWENGRGIYITMNKDLVGCAGGHIEIVYRTISHMRDFKGGPNNFISFEMLKKPDELKKILSELKNISKNN